MAEDQDGYAEAEESRIQSIDALAEKVDRLAAMVGKVLGGGDSAEPKAEPRGSTVEDQVRAELEKAERDRQAREAAEAKDREHAELREKVERLTETKPTPAPRRSTRIMWGGQ